MDIPGCSRYQASSLGKIRSNFGKILKQREMENGYFTVCIISDFETRWYPRLVSRLVCSAFHGPAGTEDVQVRHLNGLRFDNRSENLQWGTPIENQHDRKVHGTHLSGSSGPGSKLTPDDISEIRRMLGAGMVQRRIAEKFNVDPATICFIKKGKTYRDTAPVSAFS